MAYEDNTNVQLTETSATEHRSFAATARRVGGAILKWAMGPEAQRRYPQEYSAFWGAAESEYCESGAALRRVEQIEAYLQTPEVLERSPDLKNDPSLIRDIALSRQALEQMSSFNKFPTGGLSAKELHAMGIQAEESQYDGSSIGRPYRRVLLPTGWEYRLSTDVLQSTDAEIVDDLGEPRLHITNSVSYRTDENARVTREVHQGRVDYIQSPSVSFGVDKLSS